MAVSSGVILQSLLLTNVLVPTKYCNNAISLLLPPIVMIRKRKTINHRRNLESNASSSLTTIPPKRRRISRSETVRPTSPSSRRKFLPDPSFIGGEPTAPTRQEWAKMTPYQCFMVTDSADVQHRFPVNSYALILPDGADPSDSLRLRDYWVGKIKEIRSRNEDPAEVWANVQWLWSINDVLEKKWDIDPTPFGTMERILSDHYDFVHTLCFSGIAPVAPYVESDPEPEAISHETFYYRCTYSVKKRELKSTPSATCFCGEPYNANETAVMHFCPRKGCRRAYHADCLRQGGFVEKPRKELRSLQERRALQLERTLPGSEDEDDNGQENSMPRPPDSTASSSRTLVMQPTSTDKHASLPPELLTLARSPMVKGLGSDLPFEWSCVTGNLAVVTRARKLVWNVVEKGQWLPNKWSAFLEIPGEEDREDENVDDVASVTQWAVRDDGLFLCPNCQGAI